jgi:hypothetical protein
LLVVTPQAPHGWLESRFSGLNRAGQGGYNEDHEFYGYRMPI